MFVLDTLEGWKLWLVRWLVIMLRLDLGTVYLKSMQVCIICAVFCWYLRSVNMWFCVCVLHACVCVCALMHVHAYMCVYAYMRACVCVCEWFVCSICGMNTLIKRKTHEEEHYLTIMQWILFIFILTKKNTSSLCSAPFPAAGKASGKSSASHPGCQGGSERSLKVTLIAAFWTAHRYTSRSQLQSQQPWPIFQQTALTLRSTTLILIQWHDLLLWVSSVALSVSSGICWISFWVVTVKCF